MPNLQQPSSPVNSVTPVDNPQTADSIRRALDASNDERKRISDLTGVEIPPHPMPEHLVSAPEGDR